MGGVNKQSPILGGNFSKAGQNIQDRKSKRQWKPSFKMQQHAVASNGKGVAPDSINKPVTATFGKTTFGSKLSSLTTSDTPNISKLESIKGKKYNSPIFRGKLSTLSHSLDVVEGDIKAVDTEWDSRLRKVENKFVKSGSRVEALPPSDTKYSAEDQDMNPGTPTIQPVSKTKKPLIRATKFLNHSDDLVEDPPMKSNIKTCTTTPLIRESKLKLNNKVLKQLRLPSRQVEFYQAIQSSMQSSKRKPPNLISNQQNPAGAALISSNDNEESKLQENVSETTQRKSSDKSNSKCSNRMPGHIVCGICGAVRYYSFILQAKKFGTFSCEPCRKFISKCIKMSKNASDKSELFKCMMYKNARTKKGDEIGMCIVPPVIRKTPTTPQITKKNESVNSDLEGQAAVRCQACWLKLCLIGYNLDDILYDKLRLHLSPKDIFKKLLPDSSLRKEGANLIPHRGKILEFNRHVPLSRPLFDGFGTGESEKLDQNNSNHMSDNISNSRIEVEDDREVSISDSSKNNQQPIHQNAEGKKTGKLFDDSSNKVSSKRKKNLKHLTNCCVERLPNGWTKKAVKHFAGTNFLTKQII